MIAIRTENLSPLFSDFLGLRKFLESLPGVSLIVSPGDGRDWELSGAIPEKTTVYSLIPGTSDHREIIDSHILALGVYEVVPLFPAREIKPDMDVYPEFGIYDVDSLEDITEAEVYLGRKPSLVRVSINPLKYPKEILDYCKAQGIEVLGTDIFGGRLLREYYKDLFPETFLQAFGEHNTDILEISGDDPYFIKRVYSRLGEGQDNPKLLEYSKAIDRVPSLRSHGRKIYQNLEIDLGDQGDVFIQADKGKFSLKPREENFNLGDPLWEDDLVSEDIDPKDKELLGTLHRYHVLPKLSELHSPGRWKPVFTKIYPDFWAIKMIPKGWFGWMWKEYYYWMISGKLWEIPLSGHENLTNG